MHKNILGLGFFFSLKKKKTYKKMVTLFHCANKSKERNKKKIMLISFFTIRRKNIKGKKKDSWQVFIKWGNNLGLFCIYKSVTFFSTTLTNIKTKTKEKKTDTPFIKYKR